MKKYFRYLLLAIFAIVIGGVIFIKVNTQAAAEFTDNILRPLLGSNTVIFMEKIFFNASDRVQQLTQSGNVNAPDFSYGEWDNATGAANLSTNKIPPIASFNQVKNEGVWKFLKLDSFPNENVFAYTFVRPDPERSYAIVTIAQMDMRKMRLGVVAGTKEPGGKIGNPGPGVVPSDIIENNSLIAAFDGGFQYRDGQYGMIVGEKTYLPLQNNLGTLIGYKDGSLKIIDYSGQNLGSDVTFVRQNCPILLNNGIIAPEDIKNKKLWGRTLTSDIYTWRSGIGLTKDGNLLFAVGNSLTPTTLAQALKMAGAENAIQLDINPNWVRFNIFTPLGNGQYSSKTLTKDLKSGAHEYLNGYSKDFFYLYKR